MSKLVKQASFRAVGPTRGMVASTSFHYLLTKLLSSPYIVIATTYIVIGTNKLNCLVLSSCVNEYMLMVMFWLLQKRVHFIVLLK